MISSKSARTRTRTRTLAANDNNAILSTNYSIRYFSSVSLNCQLRNSALVRNQRPLEIFFIYFAETLVVALDSSLSLSQS
jgi:hypothetical protein